MLRAILSDLDILVAARTENPPRRIATDGGVIPWLRQRLRALGFHCALEDLGEGCINLLATRGVSRTLFNCHLDTVPACEGWSADPFALRIDEQRAVGLGACDVKGAAACLLHAAGATNAPAALLFTTDEEAGAARCVRTFCTTHAGRFDSAIIAEPTGCRAVTAHRAILTADIDFTGRSAHASAAHAATHSAIHAAVAWGHGAFARFAEDRLNIGVIEGGAKPNMIAARCRATVGLRPRPGADLDDIADALRASLPDGACLSERFRAPGLPSGVRLQFLEAADIPVADPVDFWTEAALFQEAGIDAVVLGPGSIAQAHAPDEFVELGQLEAAAGCYRRLMDLVA